MVAPVALLALMLLGTASLTSQAATLAGKKKATSTNTHVAREIILIAAMMVQWQPIAVQCNRARHIIRNASPLQRPVLCGSPHSSTHIELSAVAPEAMPYSVEHGQVNP